MRYVALVGLALTGWLSLCGWSHVAAQAQEGKVSALPEVLPSLTIELGGGPNLHGMGTGGLFLERDRWNHVTLYAGDVRSRSLCVGGTSMGADGATARVPSDQQPLVVWTVSARLVSFDGEAATMDVRWRREPRSDDLQPAETHEGQLQWTAGDGVSMVLDLVRQRSPAEPRCESRSIAMRFTPSGASELRRAAIAYDLWLVQRLSHGRTVTHHVHTTGQQGEHLSFFFPEVAIDVPALENTAGPPILDVGVQGRIRGRVRLDGRIDLFVEAGRAVGPRGLGLFSATIGHSRLSVTRGETVELEPVPVMGRWGSVLYADVLREAPTAIRVRATRLW